MRLGMNIGYAGAQIGDILPLVTFADRIGIDSVWAAEAYGSDAVTVLAYLAAQTERIALGSAILQMPARTPANTAMTAMTLDALSGGRMLLGLGVSGPLPWGPGVDRSWEARSTDLMASASGRGIAWNTLGATLSHRRRSAPRHRSTVA